MAKPSRKAERKVAKADRKRRALEAYQERTRRFLNREHTRELMAEVKSFESHTMLLGHLPIFASSLLVGGMVAAGMFTESPFAYGTSRVILDVPESRGILQISDPSVLNSLSNALILGIAMLVLAHLGGKALAWLLFGWPRKALAEIGPEFQRSHKLLPAWQRLLVVVLAVPIVVGVTMYMGGLATERFTAMLTASESAAALMTSFVRFLLLGTLLLQMIAEIPVFAHASALS